MSNSLCINKKNPWLAKVFGISIKRDENESWMKERAKEKKINQHKNHENFHNIFFYIYVFCCLTDRQTTKYLENYWTNESSEKEFRVPS